MKYLGHRNIKDATLRKVFTILGYDIYIPLAYDNPISRFQKGCAIWVNHDDNGDCEVYEILSKDTLYPTLVKIIQDDYPARVGYCCKPLTNDIARKLNLNITHYYELSSVCYNEKDEIKAAVCIEKEDLNGGKYAKMKVLNKDNNALCALRDYMFSEININNYRGLQILYEARNQSEIECAQLFNMKKWEEGKYLLEI